MTVPACSDDQTEHFGPVLANDIDPNAPPEQRLQLLVGSRGCDARELAVWKVAQARAEPKAQHGAEGEHMIRCTAGVGIVRANLQCRAVVHQAVEHVGSFVAGRRHHADAVGSVLVRDVGIEFQARIVAVARVHLPGGIATLGRTEELSVGGRGGAVAPDRCSRQSVVGIDDLGQRRLVGLGTNIGIGGPDQLITRDALAGGRHAAEPEIGGIRQNHREQRVLILAVFAGAQIGEDRREAGGTVHFVQQRR